MLQKIEKLVLCILKDLFNYNRGVCTESPKYLAMALCLLDEIYKAVLSNTYVQQRQLYYSNNHLFTSQREMQSVLQRLMGILEVESTEDLHIVASGKGLIYGNVIISGQTNIDCFQAPTIIPSQYNINSINIKDAKQILIVEKDTVFSKIRSCMPPMFFQDTILLTVKGNKKNHIGQRLSM
jgi:DNA topoisomerase VI subunit A